MVNQYKEPIGPEPNPFPIPDDVLPKIAADEQAFSEEFDRQQANPVEVAAETRRKLIAQGVGRTTLTAEEVEAEEITRLAEARRVAAEAKKDKPTTKIRPSRNARTDASTRPGIRKLPGYDKGQPPKDPTNL